MSHTDTPEPETPPTWMVMKQSKTKTAAPVSTVSKISMYRVRTPSDTNPSALHPLTPFMLCVELCDTGAHWPVAVTMKGPRLTHGAIPLVAAISAVQLVVASLRQRVALRLAGRCRPLSCHSTGKVIRTAVPAALLVLSGLGTVPLPIAVLLLCKTTSCRSPATTFPRRAVALNMKRGVKVGVLCAKNSFIHHWHHAGVGFNLDRFGIGGAGNLWKCRRVFKKNKNK